MSSDEDAIAGQILDLYAIPKPLRDAWEAIRKRNPQLDLSEIPEDAVGDEELARIAGVNRELRDRLAELGQEQG